MSKLTIRNLDDMSVSFPRFVKATRVLQPKFVTNRKADFATLQLGETEPRHALLVQTKVPAHRDIRLCLRFLKPFVVISFDLDERSEDVLVLISIFIAKDYGLRLVVYAGFFQVFQRCTGVFAPQVLEAVNLLERNLAGPKLLSFARRFHEPREEGPIID